MGVAGKDYRQVRDKAASAGSVAHALIEAYLNKREPEIAHDTPQDVIDKGTAAYEQALKWIEQTRIRFISTEHSMVSEKYRFGGTPDALGIIDDKLVLPDWKSSNKLYADMLIQVAAYGKLWEENHPDQPITGGFYICRFSKDYPDFEVKHFGELEEAWRLFLLYRQAYDLSKRLEKRAA